MRRFLLISSIVLLTSCSGIVGTLSGFGGGPTVNANVLAGKENTQQIVGSQTNDSISTGAKSTVNKTDNNQRVQAETVEKIVVNEGIPVSLFLGVALVGLLGWILPTPGQMGEGVARLFRRKRNG